MTTTTVAPTLLPPAEVLHRIKLISEEANTKFFERRSVIQAIILAMLAKEHGVILGRPGTAKSAMVRYIFSAFTGARYFETLLSKSRPAEAVLGPYDIPSLRDRGDLHRKYKGFLPDCEFAMLDEFGKMSSTLGHDMLPVLLERRLHQVNGGRSWIDVPLYSFFGGSNEIPTQESEDAAALWDRVLIRTTVDYIVEAGNFVAMLTGEITPPSVTIDFPSLANVIDNVVPTIPIPQDVLETILTLRDSLAAEEIVPSDRRWVQCMKLLRAAAFLRGGTEVDVDDLQMLRFALWEDPTQIDKVERLTLKVSNPLAEMALALREKAAEIHREAREGKGLPTGKRAELAVDLNGKLKDLTVEFSNIRQKALATGASTVKLDEVGDYITQVKRGVFSGLLSMDDKILA